VLEALPVDAARQALEVHARPAPNGPLGVVGRSGRLCQSEFLLARHDGHWVGGVVGTSAAYLLGLNLAVYPWDEEELTSASVSCESLERAARRNRLA